MHDGYAALGPRPHGAPRQIDTLRHVLGAVQAAQVQALVDDVAAATRIVAYGVGREGLCMRAFAMRLGHLGLQVGETAPAAD